jgi:hypothetical protein
MSILPPSRRRPVRFRLLRAGIIPLLVSTWAGSGPAAAAESWEPVSPAELAPTKSAEYPDAPAEILSWHIDIDELEYPVERRIVEHLRYKIYDPAQAADLTRIQALTAPIDGADAAAVDIRAQLTLPDGTSKEFGKEAILERAVPSAAAKQPWLSRLLSGPAAEAKERYLAVPGITAGAILDVQLTEIQNPAPAWLAYALQKETYPIREVTYVQHLSRTDQFKVQSYLANDKDRQVQWSPDAKQELVQVTARNLPPLAQEPFSAPLCDRALTVFASYAPRVANFFLRNEPQYIRLDPKAGPWVAVGTLAYMYDHDATPLTKATRELAAKVAGDAPTETAKAQRIHRYVAAAYQRYLKFMKETQVPTRGMDSSPWSLMKVANFEDYPAAKIQRRDFLWLELGLDRAVGLEAQTVLLPNRQLMRFNPQFVSDLFLHEDAARVRVDGAWRFSLPTADEPLPFGLLPWYHQDTFALIGQANKQEFVRVSPQPAAQSAIETTGEFTLGTDGGLTGRGRRTLTGSLALALRSRLRGSAQAEQIAAVERSLKDEYPLATASVSQLAGVDDPDQPLTYAFDLDWKAYGVVSGQRITFHPSVFHGTAASPFTAASRHGVVDFPYHWRELDELSIHLPAGYEFERPSAPASFPREDLNYQVSLAYAAPTRLLQLRRDFSSELTYIQPANYPALQGLYANIARSDAHELTLARSQPAAPGSEAPKG